MTELQGDKSVEMSEWLPAATMNASSYNGDNRTTSAEKWSCPHDDNSFKYHAYIFTYVLVFPVAFLCNILALLVFFKQNKRRGKPSYVIMVNLALSDGSFSLTLPLRLAYYMNDGRWYFPDWLCRLCVYGFYVNLYSSILLLTLLSLLRWFSIAYPYKHHLIGSAKPTLITCLAIWLFVGASSAPFLSNGVVTRDGQRRCFEPATPRSWARILSLNYVGVIFGFVVPFFTIILCYSKILKCLKSPPVFHDVRSRRRLRKKNRRSMYLITMVIATFLLCFLPYHVVRTLHLQAVNGQWSCGIQNLLQRAVAVTLCMAASNSVVNPLLYYYSTKNFKEDVSKTRSLVSRRFSTRGHSQRSNGGGSFKAKHQEGNSIRMGNIENAAQSLKNSISCLKPADLPERPLDC